MPVIFFNAKRWERSFDHSFDNGFLFCRLSLSRPFTSYAFCFGHRIVALLSESIIGSNDRYFVNMCQALIGEPSPNLTSFPNDHAWPTHIALRDGGILLLSEGSLRKTKVRFRPRLDSALYGRSASLYSWISSILTP